MMRSLPVDAIFACRFDELVVAADRERLGIGQRLLELGGQSVAAHALAPDPGFSPVHEAARPPIQPASDVNFTAFQRFTTHRAAPG
jgi:hypothetical protein